MPVLIDGNNLLYAVRAVEDDARPFGRFMLAQALGEWARRTGQHVALVFDGPAPPPEVAGQQGHPSVRVVYSGAGRSADAAIHAIVASDSAARRLVVVTSDREVARAAKRYAARTLASDEFWRGVRRTLARPQRTAREPQSKRDGLEPGAIEDWLREFGLDEGQAHN